MQPLQYPLTLTAHRLSPKQPLIYNRKYYTRLIIIVQAVIPEARAVHDAAVVPHGAAIQ